MQNPDDVRTVERLSERAYARPMYTPSGWRQSARLLLRAGWRVEAVLWFLHSKHMRWAANASLMEYGRVTSRAVRNYLIAFGNTPECLRQEAHNAVALEASA